MPDYYERYQVRVKPRAWQNVANWLTSTGTEQLENTGGKLYGVWSGQIGLASNEGVVMTVWPDAERAVSLVLDNAPDIVDVQRERLVSTVRPQTTEPPAEPWIYAHRWFHIQERDWPEFLELSKTAWNHFEVENEIQVVGFWLSLDVESPAAKVWLMTRYASLAVWEGSRTDKATNDEQKEAARRFIRRHELTESTSVVTTRLHR
ncbi:MAG: hypothetical protein AAF512_16570 [Pseudomonadota bacterium]